MKRQCALLTVTAGLCLGGLGLPGCAQSKEAAPSATAQPADLGNTVCPVSLDKVGDSKLMVVYQGKIYHFCCDDCPKKFDADPDKYANAIAADPAKYGVKQ